MIARSELNLTALIVFVKGLTIPRLFPYIEKQSGRGIMQDFNGVGSINQRFEEITDGKPYALIAPHIGSMVVVYLGNVEAPEGSYIPCHGLQYGGQHGNTAFGARTGERYGTSKPDAVLNPLSALIGRSFASEAELAKSIHALGFPIYRGSLLDAVPRRVH